MAIDFSQPNSLLKAVVTSGMMTNTSYLENKKCFISRACGAWYNLYGNTLSCETEKHEDMAGELHYLYVMMHEFVQAHSSLTFTIYGEVLKALVKCDLDQAYKQYALSKKIAMSSLKKPERF